MKDAIRNLKLSSRIREDGSYLEHEGAKSELTPKMINTIKEEEKEDPFEIENPYPKGSKLFIKTEMIKFGYTKKEVAQLFGVSQGNVSQWNEKTLEKKPKSKLDVPISEHKDKAYKIFIYERFLSVSENFKEYMLGPWTPYTREKEEIPKIVPLPLTPESKKVMKNKEKFHLLREKIGDTICLLYTSPSPRD